MEVCLDAPVANRVGQAGHMKCVNRSPRPTVWTVSVLRYAPIQMSSVDSGPEFGSPVGSFPAGCQTRRHAVVATAKEGISSGRGSRPPFVLAPVLLAGIAGPGLRRFASARIRASPLERA